jgi:hypothetical protein
LVSRLHHDLAAGKTWKSPFRNALFIYRARILAYQVVPRVGRDVGLKPPITVVAKPAR